MEIVSIPAIVAIVCGIVEVLKKKINSDGFDKFIPLICVILGAVIGVCAFYFYPEIIPADNIILSAIIGAVSGWAATGANQTIKQLTK